MPKLHISQQKKKKKAYLQIHNVKYISNSHFQYAKNKKMGGLKDIK